MYEVVQQIGSPLECYDIIDVTTGNHGVTTGNHGVATGNHGVVMKGYSLCLY